MQIGQDGTLHLTYCSKIHPAHGWDEVFSHLKTAVPALKARLSPEMPFGLGLRLSAVESEEILLGGRLEKFQEFLAANDLYVFTLNGFPYGSFHKNAVKSAVFAPDWQEEARVSYTLRLIEVLKQLLPEGVEGSISTSPLSYKPWMARGDREAMARIVRNLVRVARMLIWVKETENRTIHLDLEPEPDGLLERSDEVVEFYQNWLLPVGAPLLGEALEIPVPEAGARLRAHLQVCLDTCHLAVAYENPAEALDFLERYGIRIGKVQITAGLKVSLPRGKRRRADLAAQLEPFSRSPYLHQVVAQTENGGRRQFRDLSEALSQVAETTDREWRIHFHVPLFVDRYRMLVSTRDDTEVVLRLVKERGFSRHLEIETYTWNWLPADMKEDLLESLRREYLWVLGILGESPV